MLQDIDLLLYTPHGNNDPKWISTIQPLLQNTSPISQEILLRYQGHEADFGADEVIIELAKILKREYVGKNIVCLHGEIPRAWSDLNRPWEASFPELIRGEDLKYHYDSHKELAQELHKRSRKTLHIHTMCGKNPVFPFRLHANIGEEEIEYFLENGYCGDERSIDFLYATCEGRIVGDKNMAKEIENQYQQHGFGCTHHGAYALKESYPATQFLEETGGCLIEIPKPLLATTSTQSTIDASSHKLDREKVKRHAKIIALGLQSYLK